MDNTLLRSLVSYIQCSSWLLLLLMKQLISRNDQMSLFIRWTDDKYQIYEDCLGLIQFLPNTKVNYTIYYLLKNVLIRCSLSLGHCKCEAFDGAASHEWCEMWGASINKERRDLCTICSLLGT